MRPVASLDRDEARRLRGLLFDLDDTLLTRGALTREAYGALCDLHDAGLRLVAVTGRPTVWGEVVARQWPIDGAVTENGAVRIVRDGHGVTLREDCDAAERSARRERLAAMVARVKTVVPEVELADDVAGRRADVAWDIGERLKAPVDRVDAIAAEIVAAGARTTRSSVHIHATFDPADKATGAIAFLRETFGEDAGVARGRYAFIGDSGNDAACFGAFTTTFGVANVRPNLGRIAVPPRYVASREMGAGFAEVAAALLARRAS
jgi:HAD superfamily hydrolase (TIGR01484 family)